MYFYLTVLLNFLVDFLLLMGANRLAGFPHMPIRCILAAGISGIYGGLCLKYSFLGMFLWHLVSLVLISAVAYGISITMLRRGALFILLRLAVGGIASGHKGMGLLAAAAVIDRIFPIIPSTFFKKLDTTLTTHLLTINLYASIPIPIPRAIYHLICPFPISYRCSKTNNAQNIQ